MDVLKEDLLKDLAEYEGDSVLVPVAIRETGSSPLVRVAKEQVVKMVQDYGGLWYLQEIDGETPRLEPADVPSDFHMD